MQHFYAQYEGRELFMGIEMPSAEQFHAYAEPRELAALAARVGMKEETAERIQHLRSIFAPGVEGPAPRRAAAARGRLHDAPGAAAAALSSSAE